MKMKKQLSRTLNWFALSSMIWMGLVQAADLELKADEMWSVNGGVFQPATQAIPDDVGQLLIKNAAGKIRLVNVQSKDSAEFGAVTVVGVDRTSPVITSEFNGVIRNSEQVIAGPDSELVLSVENGTLAVITDAQITQAGNKTIVRGFKTDETIVVSATDDFGNVSEQQFKLTTDSKPPEVSWQLAEPAIQSERGWFAGKQAQMSLQAKDDSGIASIQVNGQPIQAELNAIAVNSGDRLSVVDQLGNVYQEVLSWQQDDEAPKVMIKEGQSWADLTSNIAVKVDEVFELSAMDNGVGLATQEYIGRYAKWQDLPKKFRFTAKGYYRIKVLAKDKVGNVLQRTIRVKVRK